MKDSRDLVRVNACREGTVQYNHTASWFVILLQRILRRAVVLSSIQQAEAKTHSERQAVRVEADIDGQCATSSLL